MMNNVETEQAKKKKERDSSFFFLNTFVHNKTYIFIQTIFVG